MSDLTLTEQKHVRTAMRALRGRMGDRAALAGALRFAFKTVQHVMDGSISVSASMALRVARLAGVPVDDLLSGRYAPGACPKCGHISDFADEPPSVEDATQPKNELGLKVIR